MWQETLVKVIKTKVTQNLYTRTQFCDQGDILIDYSETKAANATVFFVAVFDRSKSKVFFEELVFLYI